VNTLQTATIGSTCTNLAQIPISVPSSGSVVVRAQVSVRVNHVSGTDDLGYLVIGSTPTDCIVSGPFYHWHFGIPAGDTTVTELLDGYLQQDQPVLTGLNTFYLNGVMSSGQDAGDTLYAANMIAEFYPA